jgi:gamma-glutamylcyclotransferase (GGCT)/AIG2-like uncharacterized protein YtfP
MPLYFAYGLNMDVPAMAARCPASRPIGPARLARHRFVITSDGYASVLRDPRRTVHGLLWDLALADVASLDRFEALGRLYSKVSQGVLTAEGPRRALVYIGKGTPGGKPQPGYLASVIAAARAAGLPAAAIAEMEALEAEARGQRLPGPARAARPAAPTGWRWEP